MIGQFLPVTGVTIGAVESTCVDARLGVRLARPFFALLNKCYLSANTFLAQSQDSHGCERAVLGKAGTQHSRAERSWLRTRAAQDLQPSQVGGNLLFRSTWKIHLHAPGVASSLAERKNCFLD